MISVLLAGSGAVAFAALAARHVHQRRAHDRVARLLAGQSAILEQVEAGVAVRMAVLYLLAAEPGERADA